MRRAIFSALLTGLLLSSPLAPCRADDKDSWVGKTVFTKKPGTHFGVTRDDKDVDFGALNEPFYKVLAEQGKWIKVRQQDKEGWFAKADAVPLEEAVDYFTRRIDSSPQDAYAYKSRGHARRLGSELDLALKDYDEAIRLAPKEAAYRFGRGTAWHETGDYDKAIKDYNEAIQLDPKYTLAYHTRGLAWRAKGDYDKAIGDFTEAIKLEPKDAVALNDRAVAWITKKEYDKAVKDFDEAVRVNPKYGTPLGNKAYLLATCPDEKFRDGKKAKELATQACELTEWKDGWNLMSLAAACAEVGEFDDAIKWQKKALEDKAYYAQEAAKASKRLKWYGDKKPWREE
jgi:tetratricopeptide (TPR) repeat protein